MQHDAARFKSYFFGLEGREAASDLVGIHELAAVQHFGQDGEGGRGFARPVAARDEVEGFVRHERSYVIRVMNSTQKIRCYRLLLKPVILRPHTLL